MKLFQRKETPVKVRLAGTVFAVPPFLAAHLRAIDKRLAELIADNARLTSAADALDQAAEELKRRYADERRAADQVMAGLRKALAGKQAELVNALAQFKQLDRDYIQACGERDTAREELAGYRLEVRS